MSAHSSCRNCETRGVSRGPFPPANGLKLVEYRRVRLGAKMLGSEEVEPANDEEDAEHDDDDEEVESLNGLSYI